MEILFIWLGLSFVVGLIGQNKDLGCAGAFFISLLLSPLIGLIAVAVSSSKKKEEPPKAPNASSQTQVEMETENPEKKECPYCGFEDESGSQFCPGCERDAKGNTKEHYKRMAEDPEYKRRVQEEEERQKEVERKEQERIKDEEERQLRKKQEEQRKKQKRDWILLASTVGAIVLLIFISRQFSGSSEDEASSSELKQEETQNTSSSREKISTNSSEPLKMGKNYHNEAFGKNDYNELLEDMEGLTRIQTEKYYLGLRSGYKLKITQKNDSELLDKMQKDLTNQSIDESLSSVTLNLSKSVGTDENLVFLGETEKGDKVSIFFQLTDQREGVIKIQCCGESQGPERYNLIHRGKVKSL